MIFLKEDFDGHEQIIYCYDQETDLKAIIAIHNTFLGPAVGGCRMWPYATEEEALKEALKLSRNMTYKAAVANLPLGGGQTILIGNPRRDKTDVLLKQVGHFIEKLKGQYILAEDIGITPKNLETIGRETSYVLGAHQEDDPAPYTAYGIYRGICAAFHYKFKTSRIEGARVIVQGLGQVGYNLCRHLKANGAELLVYDIQPALVEQACKEFDALPLEPEAVYKTPAEVFSPCAFGNILNDQTIQNLKVPIIAGGANNQLSEARHGFDLAQHDILYVPDYVVNSGGLIALWYDREKRGQVFTQVDGIYETVLEVFNLADFQKIPTSQAADQLAESRLRRQSRES